MSSRYQPRSIILLLLFALLLPLLARADSSNGTGTSGGGGTTITSGAGAFGAATSQTGGVLTGALAAPYNTAYGQPAVNELGSIANAGTATCNFAATYVCHFTVASGASFTLGNPSNLPAGALVIISYTQAGTGTPGITYGTAFYGYDAKGGANNVVQISSNSGDFPRTFYVNATTGEALTIWYSNGTQLTQLEGSSLSGHFDNLNVAQASNFRGTLTLTNGAGLTLQTTSTLQIQGSAQINSSQAAAISGGGALATGSNSLAGRITGLAATSNVLTPGFTCTNAVECIFRDDTTAGGVKMTAQSQTTITFSATASDAAAYWCGCR